MWKYLQMGIRERDLEELKEFLFRQPLHVLIASQVIGALQTTLRMLAFKNEITFFKGRSDYTGLSSRSLATDVVQEIVIFLYLFDFDTISRLVCCDQLLEICTCSTTWDNVAVFLALGYLRPLHCQFAGIARFAG